MEYELRIHSAFCGDVIRLAQVAEAMARHAASGYGKLPFHGPTYENVLPQRASMLLGAAKKGTLLVCDAQGNVVDADELIKASKIPADWFPDFSGRDIHSLYVKSQHLIEWGRLNGDVFNIADSLGKMVEFDLKNESGDVVAAGFFRGVVGGGETNSTEPQAAPVAKGTTTAAPMPKQRVQESRILELLTSKGHNPLALPSRTPGKRGAKSEIKKLALLEPALFTAKTFDTAWQRLREDGRVVGGG